MMMMMIVARIESFLLMTGFYFGDKHRWLYELVIIVRSFATHLYLTLTSTLLLHTHLVLIYSHSYYTPTQSGPQQTHLDFSLKAAYDQHNGWKGSSGDVVKQPETVELAMKHKPVPHGIIAKRAQSAYVWRECVSEMCLVCYVYPLSNCWSC